MFFSFWWQRQTLHASFFYNKLCMTKQYTRISVAQLKSIGTKMHVCTRKSLCHVFNRTIGGARSSTRCWDIGIRRRSGEFLSWWDAACYCRERSRTCARPLSSRGFESRRRWVLPGVGSVWLLCYSKNCRWLPLSSVGCPPVAAFSFRRVARSIPSSVTSSNSC